MTEDKGRPSEEIGPTTRKNRPLAATNGRLFDAKRWPSRANGPPTRVEGPSHVENGRLTKDRCPVIENKGRGSRNKGRVTENKGRATEDKGPLLDEKGHPADGRVRPALNKVQWLECAAWGRFVGGRSPTIAGELLERGSFARCQGATLTA
jgi:hypothetical protein